MARLKRACPIHASPRELRITVTVHLFFSPPAALSGFHGFFGLLGNPIQKCFAAHRPAQPSKQGKKYTVINSNLHIF
ncbi:MAG: hypothetical protein E5V21_08785 [Mesorhizobium sp.]|nr:MAG: hypothetical protein E5V21_08785 [Mesorhizobium sp.]